LNFSDDVPDDAKALQAKLADDTGKQLDKDYMDSMVEDHQKDVQEFKDQSQNAKDPDVKQWASKTLPTLQKTLTKPADRRQTEPRQKRRRHPRETASWEIVSSGK